VTALEALAPHFAEPRQRYSGVYFLIDGDEIVYVGKSVDIVARLFGHGRARDGKNRKRRVRKFDRSAWIAAPVDQIAALEAAFIRRLAPRYNTKHGVKTSPLDEQLLAPYDLPPVDPQRWAALEKRRGYALFRPIRMAQRKRRKIAAARRAQVAA